MKRHDGSKKGSGYGGMQFAVCPNCGGKFKKSFWQHQENALHCLNRKKCKARQLRKGANDGQE
jgi:hypothetical protein